MIQMRHNQRDCRHARFAITKPGFDFQPAFNTWWKPGLPMILDLEPHHWEYDSLEARAIFRTNGGDSGDWVGGYNQSVDGWIQVSSRVSPGMSLSGWSSSRGGSQYSVDVTVRLWNGNWWVRVDGEWAGYYPYCKGGDARPCDEGTLSPALEFVIRHPVSTGMARCSIERRPPQLQQTWAAVNMPAKASARPHTSAT